ncbi:MAG: hypothetical protein RIS42_1146 [Bacteroidota bacterium]|jgi:hypothetical protein
MYKRIFILICLLFLIQLDLDAQCAMCRTTVESTVSNGRSNIATGLNTGILYLLTAPYLLVGAVAWLWFKQSKQEQKERIAKWQLRQRVSQLLSKSN